MMTSETTDRAVLVWHAAIAMLADVAPKGSIRDGEHGTRMLNTNSPISTLNGIFSTTRQPDLAELSSFATWFGNSIRSPWTIQIRGDAMREPVAEVAKSYGLANSFPLPFLTKSLSETDLALPAVSNVAVRRIAQEEYAIYRRALAAGFGAPEQIFEKLCGPEVMGLPQMYAYLVEENGVPVATSFGIVTDGYVGVFNIATLPAYRLHGYARLATSIVLRDAYENGAHTAVLHCTVAGRRVYESLGFQEAETWWVFGA